MLLFFLLIPLLIPLTHILFSSLLAISLVVLWRGNEEKNKKISLSLALVPLIGLIAYLSFWAGYMGFITMVRLPMPVGVTFAAVISACGAGLLYHIFVDSLLGHVGKKGLLVRHVIGIAIASLMAHPLMGLGLKVSSMSFRTTGEVIGFAAMVILVPAIHWRSVSYAYERHNADVSPVPSTT